MLKSVDMEIRVLAASRQHSQLASILSLLLDRCEAGEDAEDLTSSLYQDSTFIQLSRTVASTHNKQLESPASNHRLAMVLSFIDFEMEAVTSLAGSCLTRARWLACWSSTRSTPWTPC